MEKSITPHKFVYKYIYKNFVCIFLVFVILCVSLMCSQYSTLLVDPPRVLVSLDVHSDGNRRMSSDFNYLNMTKEIKTRRDSCSGRKIYMYDLPSRFNEDVIKNCSSLMKWYNMCDSISNMGLGPLVSDFEGGDMVNNKSWYSTDQFSLDIIFHHKMKNYECLTNNSSLASAVYVPFYAGLDVGRYLWGANISVRDAASHELTKWLAAQKEWKFMWGRDHFFVAGRISWDFRRPTDKDSDWGNKLLLLPETTNMTMLTIESSNWGENEFAIPYPTYFHPSCKEEILDWQQNILKHERNYLFSFLGAGRPNMENSIRGAIISQCLNPFGKCQFLDCNSYSVNCNKPIQVMKMLRKSTFCLQPSGDSYTRRSTFDSILAGCIPVFFHLKSAYEQYLWHFPKNHTEYSVFIPEDDVKTGKANIEKILLAKSESEVLAMRKAVISLIPKIVYGDPRYRLGSSTEDAFDIAVKGVLERVEKIRQEIKGNMTNISLLAKD